MREPRGRRKERSRPTPRVEPLSTRSAHRSVDGAALRRNRVDRKFAGRGQDLGRARDGDDHGCGLWRDGTVGGRPGMQDAAAAAGAAPSSLFDSTRTALPRARERLIPRELSGALARTMRHYSRKQRSFVAYVARTRRDARIALAEGTPSWYVPSAFFALASLLVPLFLAKGGGGRAEAGSSRRVAGREGSRPGAVCPSPRDEVAGVAGDTRSARGCDAWRNATHASPFPGGRRCERWLRFFPFAQQAAVQETFDKRAPTSRIAAEASLRFLANALEVLASSGARGGRVPPRRRAAAAGAMRGGDAPVRGGIWGGKRAQVERGGAERRPKGRKEEKRKV